MKLDSKDIVNYPIYLSSINFDMSATTAGKEYTIDIHGLEAVYKTAPTSGVEDVLFSYSINLYPNPVKRGNSVELNMSKDDVANVEIYNISGRRVMSFKSAPLGGKLTFSTSELDIALYFIKVTQDGVSKNAKLIVN